MGESPDDRVGHHVEIPADVFGEQAEHEVAVLLRELVLPSISTVGDLVVPPRGTPTGPATHSGCRRGRRCSPVHGRASGAAARSSCQTHREAGCPGSGTGGRTIPDQCQGGPPSLRLAGRTQVGGPARPGGGRRRTATCGRHVRNASARGRRASPDGGTRGRTRAHPAPSLSCRSPPPRRYRSRRGAAGTLPRRTVRRRRRCRRGASE